jgi:Alginate lyase
LKKYIFISLFCLVQQVLIAQTAINYNSNDSFSLKKVKSLIESGDSKMQAALNELVKAADVALTYRPVSVMEKKNNPPSGDKHDYMSLAPYFWPNPETKDGLPYIRKDGQINPEVNEYKDKEYLPQLCSTLETLGLAYYFTNDKRYASHASKLINVWFLDPSTKMNPNLNFGQAVKGQNDGRGAGLIDTRHLIKVVDAVSFIANSSAWSSSQDLQLKSWFAQFLNWMETSKNGVDELDATNNHGIWYDAQRLSFALYTGNKKAVSAIIESAQKRIAAQMNADGFFPAELARTTSLHYSLFVVEAFIKVAQLSKNTNVNFWNYTAPNGNSLEKACDVLMPYLLKQKEWTGEQIKPFNFDEANSLFIAVAAKKNCVPCFENIYKNSKYKLLQTIY